MNLLGTESYADVLTGGRRRKRPKLANGVTDLSTLLATAEVHGGKPLLFEVENIFVFLVLVYRESLLVPAPVCDVLADVIVCFF